MVCTTQQNLLGRLRWQNCLKINFLGGYKSPLNKNWNSLQNPLKLTFWDLVKKGKCHKINQSIDLTSKITKIQTFYITKTKQAWSDFEHFSQPNFLQFGTFLAKSWVIAVIYSLSSIFSENFSPISGRTREIQPYENPWFPSFKLLRTFLNIVMFLLMKIFEFLIFYEWIRWRKVINEERNNFYLNQM